jgi:hypothetical protein
MLSAGVTNAFGLVRRTDEDNAHRAASEAHATGHRGRLALSLDGTARAPLEAPTKMLPSNSEPAAGAETVSGDILMSSPSFPSPSLRHGVAT